MKTFFVYILQCGDSSYYTGVTSDLNKRFKQHKNGVHTDSYTFSRRPVSLIYFEEYTNPSYAIERETQIKGWSKKKKEALINQNYDRLKELAECHNITSYKNYKES